MVIASPTAVKSFAIKFVEILHVIENVSSFSAEVGGEVSTRVQPLKTGSQNAAVQRGLFARMKHRLKGAGERARQAALTSSLKQQASICVDILQLLQQGVLMLDEASVQDRPSAPAALTVFP